MTTIPPGYRPNSEEPYMNDRQLEYFRQKLIDWRAALQKDADETLGHLQEAGPQEPDPVDQAAVEVDRSLELRTRDRARKLIAKIDAALERVANGSYGYCQETGEPIGLSRLEARPVATLCIEAQERHERLERTQSSE